MCQNFPRYVRVCANSRSRSPNHQTADIYAISRSEFLHIFNIHLIYITYIIYYYIVHRLIYILYIYLHKIVKHLVLEHRVNIHDPLEKHYSKYYTAKIVPCVQSTGKTLSRYV